MATQVDSSNTNDSPASKQQQPQAKGSGGSGSSAVAAKKQAGAQSKPPRQDIDKKINVMKAVLSDFSDEALERALEKNNYDANNAMEYLMEAGSHQNEWQQVSSKSKEAKGNKTAEKRNGHDGTSINSISERKDKGESKAGEYDKRPAVDRDDSRLEGSRSDRKPKKPAEGARFKPEGEGADGVPRAPRDRDRDFKSNGSPNPQNRPPRRSSGPANNAPGSKPTQPFNTLPPQHVQPTSTLNAWGPSGDALRSQSTHTQPPSTSVSAQSSQTTSVPFPSTNSRSSSFNSTASQPSTAMSYSKIVQGNKQQPPAPQQLPTPPTPPTPIAAPSTNSSTSQPSSVNPTKGDFQSPLGTRSHPARNSPPSSAWRPKDTSLTSLSPVVTTPPQATPTPSTVTSTPTPSTSVPLAAATPQSTPAQAQVPQTQSQVSTHVPQAAPVPSQTTQPQTTQTQATPAPQPVQTPQQPTPISPPSAIVQPKRQSVLIDGSNLRLPPSLQYAENLSIQFGSMGFDSKAKDSSLLLNLGTQPTSAPLTQQPQTIHTTTAAHHPATTPPPTHSHTPTHTQPTATTHHTVQPTTQPQQTQHTTTAAQLAHSPHTPATHQPTHPTHPTHHTHPSHVTQHIPSHVSQQQSHLNGDHAGMGGHIVQSDDMHQMQAAYPYGMPGYFHMPAAGFGGFENPDDSLRLRSGGYYDHPTTPGYVAPDSTTSQSAVPQNSQSPPPQTPSQYPTSYYYPPYMYHPYQTSAPGHAQFQQFPGSYMYGYGNSMRGYPPAHPSSSPSNQSHSQYDESDSYKYLPQQGSYSNFYNPSATAGSGASVSGSSQGVQQGSGSSVNKPGQSFSPSATSSADTGSKQDYKGYGGAHLTDPTTFSYNMSNQPTSFHSQHQPAFMQQHLGGGQHTQNIPSHSQSGGYHHSAQQPQQQQQPLSNTPAGQNSGGAPRGGSHYTGRP